MFSPAPTITPTLPPELHPRLLDLLHSPHLSLPEIAVTLNVSLHQLTTFLASESGATLIADAERAHTLRARLIAATHLPQVATLLADILTQTHEDLKRTAALASVRENNSEPVTPDRATSDITSAIPDALIHLRHVQLRETQRANARRAAQLLVRLSRATPRATGLPPGASAQKNHDRSAPTATHTPSSPTPSDQHNIPLHIHDLIRATAFQLTAERYPGWSPSQSHAPALTPTPAHAPLPPEGSAGQARRTFSAADVPTPVAHTEGAIHETCAALAACAPFSQPRSLNSNIDPIPQGALTPAHRPAKHNVTPLALALAAGVPP